MNSEKTDWGFPRGKVASTLRSILSKDFTDDDIDTIAVVLMSHSLVEVAIERVLYLTLNFEYPHYEGNLEKKRQDDLCEAIEGMTFWGKFRLIEPCFKISDPGLIKQMRNINRVRNKIAHLEKINDLKFKDKLIRSEEGLEEFFVTCQCVAKQIDRLWERIDDQHALYERWAKRLQELGDPLM